MKSRNAQLRTWKPFGNRSPKLEHLEDRTLPGEVLTGLLLLPMGSLSIPEFVGGAVAVSEDSSAFAVTEMSPAGGATKGLLADTGERELLGGSALFSGLDRPVRDDQARDVSFRMDRATDSVHDSLFPGTAPAADILGGVGEFLPPSFAQPAPQPLAGATIERNGSASQAGPLAAVPGNLPGATSISGSVATAAPAEGTSALPAASGSAVASPLLKVYPAGHHGGGGGGGTPSGYSPAQIRHAYGFDKLTQSGKGTTIGIVDAYDDPNIVSDLNTFSAKFGLPTTTSGVFTFTKAYAQGSKPSANGGWAQEISLDVEWAHAIAPQANIMLVESASNSFTNLLGGVDYAVNHGASVVSMSWGASDFSGESTYDTHFLATGVTFLASSGDSGGVVIYPSASPYVVSVGGTTLMLDSSGNLTSAETAWSSGGGGPSLYEPEPGYQTSYGILLGGRGTPDVAYDANPNTGFAVYDSYSYSGMSGWLVFGGTSAGAPQWAGLVALADQGRLTALSSSNLLSSPVYNAATGSAYATNYRDITSGSNGYPATVGYDLATGLGSPLANNLVPYLNSH